MGLGGRTHEKKIFGGPPTIGEGLDVINPVMLAGGLDYSGETADAFGRSCTLGMLTVGPFKIVSDQESLGQADCGRMGIWDDALML